MFRWLLILLLAGCAEPMTQDFPPSKSYEWVVVATKKHLHDICAIPFDRNPTLAACAFQIQETGKCWIYSIWEENEARRMQAQDGLNLWEHEMRHCHGFRHPQ